MVDPFESKTYDKVWLYEEFAQLVPEFSQKDLGVDLVAHRRDGGYAAIQCKFYAENTVIDAAAVGTFLGKSSAQFTDPLWGAGTDGTVGTDGATEAPKVTFTERIWVSTTEKWGPNALELLRGAVPYTRFVYLANLADANVRWEAIYKGESDDKCKGDKPTPRDYQQVVVDKAMRHYLEQGHERGTLVMACGTGKTLTSLFVVEEYCRRMRSNTPEDAKDAKTKPVTVLFLAPSIALVNQTLRCWVACHDGDMGCLCVCSDPKAGVTRDPSTDETDILTEDLNDLPVTSCTDPKRVAQELIRLRGQKELTVIFSTYQSIEVVHEATQQVMEMEHFDFAICDEAHRTSTVLSKERVSKEQISAYTRIHDAAYIPARHRMYMTATPRIYRSADKDKAKMYADQMFSMDDEAVFGPTFHTLSFGTAVDKGLLTDYKVLILTVNPNTVSEELLESLKMQSDAMGVGTSDGGPLNHVTPEMCCMMMGTLSALSKQVLDGGEDFFADEGKEERSPMQTCIAFCDNVMRTRKTKGGKYVINETAGAFEFIAQRYEQKVSEEHGGLTQDDERYLRHMTRPVTRYVSGAMSTVERDEQLRILREPVEGETHIVCNVNCLSEGVDVPALDAIAFLAAKSSPITLIQSVGRVMRRFQGKRYGYVIVPVVVPMDAEAERELDNNERYKLVWDVLNALRSHDERLAAELSNHTYVHVSVVEPKPNPFPGPGPGPRPRPNDPIIPHLPLEFTDKLYARMVERVGDRFYWARWSKKVGDLATNFQVRIRQLYDEGRYRNELDNFVGQLRESLNPDIVFDDAVTFLAQHLVTHPVFDALFAGYHFAKNNPVSRAMESMIELLEGAVFVEDREVLEDFQDNVRQVCGSLNSLSKKQDMIRTLYEQFFKTAFPKVTEQLGIVYTPVECVDFIIRSVDDILTRDFGMADGLATEGVRCLDPFAGTGTFTVRALEYLGHQKMVSNEVLRRAYERAFRCNEIVLLSYYVADVNIESAYNAMMLSRDPAAPYASYDGISLADTFELTESRGQLTFDGELGDNARLAAEEIEKPLTVIWGNPPYSVGQKSANDNAKNQSYPQLENRIGCTYAAKTGAQNKNSLYDSYIKAFRWASDRIAEQGERGGVVAFISSNGWLDGNSQEGMRRCFADEWDEIFIYDLKGNGRTSGERCRQEGEPLFAANGGKGGSLCGISINILVRLPKERRTGKCKIFYCPIANYLKRPQKFKAITEMSSILSPTYAAESIEITPNEKADWINQRDGSFDRLTLLGDKKNGENLETFFLPVYSNGLKTARDAWAYCFGKEQLEKQMTESIAFYNENRIAYNESNREVEAKDFVKYDTSKLSWNRTSLNFLQRNREINYKNERVYTSLYRPYTIQWCYFDPLMCDMVYQLPSLFPTPHHHNMVICTNGQGGTKDFSCIISNLLVDLNCLSAGTQCFPLYYYESCEEYLKREGGSEAAVGGTLPGLSAEVSEERLRELGFDEWGYRRRSAIRPWAVEEACRRMGVRPRQMAEARLEMAGCQGLMAVRDAEGRLHKRTLSDMEVEELCAEMLFFYIYGALHNPTWRQRFAPDLKKSLPRLPLPADAATLRRTAELGEKLARLHIFGASGEGAADVATLLPELPDLRFVREGEVVTPPLGGVHIGKMRLLAKDRRDVISIGEGLTLEGIPAEAYDYVVNGKSAIEWVLERVAVSQDKASGIVNDPNLWAAEHEDPDFAAELLMRVVRISVATVRLVTSEAGEIM